LASFSEHILSYTDGIGHSAVEVRQRNNGCSEIRGAVLLLSRQNQHSVPEEKKNLRWLLQIVLTEFSAQGWYTSKSSCYIPFRKQCVIRKNSHKLQSRPANCLLHECEWINCNLTYKYVRKHKPEKRQNWWWIRKLR